MKINQFFIQNEQRQKKLKHHYRRILNQRHDAKPNFVRPDFESQMKQDRREYEARQQRRESLNWFFSGATTGVVWWLFFCYATV